MNVRMFDRSAPLFRVQRSSFSVMLVISPTIYKKRRRWKESAGPVPPAALVLVSASFVAGTHPSVALVFDREVDVSGFNTNSIFVDNAVTTHQHYRGSSVLVIVGSGSISVRLTSIGSATGTGVTMNASANNGIIAADDGGTWAGATNLLLPYP